jgi:hypothetical protein
MSELITAPEVRIPATWERVARHVARALIALTGLVVLAVPMLVIAVLIRAPAQVLRCTGSAGSASAENRSRSTSSAR